MRTIAALALAALAACGTDPQGDDTAVDAVPHAGMTIDVLPLCQEAIALVRHADGTQTRTTRRFALVTMPPGADWTTRLCGQRMSPPAPACEAGAMCTGTTDVPGVHCYEARGTGELVDGKLLVNCSIRHQQFNSAGVLVGDGTSTWDSIQVVVR